MPRLATYRAKAEHSIFKLFVKVVNRYFERQQFFWRRPFRSFGSLRSKRSRTRRTKFGPRERVFAFALVPFFARPECEKLLCVPWPEFGNFVRERLLRRLKVLTAVI